MLNGHGDDLHNSNTPVELNFSSNMNPYGSNKLKGHLKSCLNKINNYPEPDAKSIALLIEKKENLPSSSVLVTNGAVEAFYLIAEHFSEKRSLIFTPSFAEYEDACKKYKHTIEYAPNTDLDTINLSGFNLVWVCNPNNPDGKVFDSNKLTRIISDNKQTTFILDEAYCHFLVESQTLQKSVAYHENLIVVASLTKRYAMPGLRLGYLVSNRSLIAKLNKGLIPWRINTLAIEAAKFCLSDNYDDKFDCNALIAESKRVQNEINEILGFEVCASETSFFLCKAPDIAVSLKKYLLGNHSMLIRDAANFRGLSENHFRISVRSKKENNKLIVALKEWKNTL